MRIRTVCVALVVVMCLAVGARAELTPLLQARIDCEAGLDPVSVAMGDLDGDGDLDLALANSTTFKVAVLLQGADGVFEAPEYYSVGINPYSVAIGEFDGDGEADLAVANFQSNTVS